MGIVLRIETLLIDGCNCGREKQEVITRNVIHQKERRRMYEKLKYLHVSENKLLKNLIIILYNLELFKENL